MLNELIKQIMEFFYSMLHKHCYVSVESFDN